MAIVNTYAEAENATLLELIKASPIQFYLTGSQFFGGATKESDTDLFISLDDWQNLSEDIKERFKFVSNNYDGYNDSNMHSLYKNEEHNIHLQIVHNLAAKIAVQNALYSSLVYLKLNKKYRRSLWSIGYSAYHAGLMRGSSK